jgi:hypothetical protein
MRGVFDTKRRGHRYRSGPHQRLKRQSDGAEDTDFSVILLCPGHHRENLDPYHRLGEQVFSHKHGIDLEDLVRALLSQFGSKNYPHPALCGQ